MDYLISTNLDTVAIKHSSGIYYTIDRKGTGEYIGSRTTVKVYYKGYYTDSTLFDESGGTPIKFSLSGLYYGWQIGIPLFDKGSKGKLFLPSDYAARDGKVRIFEIDVLDFY
jgi:FKBP-type peptidyl-prolyl cis-trans isomerase FkpA